MMPDDFIRLLEQHGFRLVDHYPHKEIDAEGNIHHSKTGWDYVVVKNELSV